MKYKLRCDRCGATCWVWGDDDPDTNGTELNFDTLPEWENGTTEFCEHVDFTIIDSDWPDDIF